MLLFLFAAMVLCHGVIHIVGFANTFGEDNSTGLIKPVPGHQGWLWLQAGLLLLVTALLLLLHGRQWHLVAFIAALFSQLLIILNWKAAKWGTIINIIILAVLLFIS